MDLLLVFAMVFSAVATANAALAGQVGNRGLIATSALSGLLDVDVATLSVLRLVGTIVTPVAVGHAVLAAIVVNSSGKVALAISAAPVRFWASFLLGTGFAISFGAAAFIVLPRL